MKYKKVIINQDPFENFDSEKRWSERGRWPCMWISAAENAIPPFGIAYSRNIELTGNKKFKIHVTADERYELFINGNLIGRGPERGDLDNWFYETYELELPAGKYNVTAIVWSLGENAPYAQMTLRHGFLLAAENEMHAQLSTGIACWQAQIITGINFSSVPFAVTGPEFKVNAFLYQWGIESGNISQSAKINCIDHGVNALSVNEFRQNHLLRPAVLPEQIRKKITAGKIRCISEKKNGKIILSNSFNQEIEIWNDLLRRKAVKIKAGETRRVIIDLENYYCAYPEITVSGGKGGKIELAWAEALFIENNFQSNKNPRDEIDDRYFIGIKDCFELDGGMNRKFHIPWWRCGRYVELIVSSGAEPLTIEALELFETRYPLEPESRIETDNKKHSVIFKTALRTLQMCLHETYMDCPYYEQLMYIGDARLQMLTNYTVSKDTKPMKKTIELIKSSILPNGLTQSRYPSRVTQIIPPFSFWWIGMIYDFALWRDEPEFICKILPSVRYVLDSFSRYINNNGFLEALPGWNFVDWPSQWRRNKDQGMPPDAEFGVNGIINWHYVYTLRLTADLHNMLGYNEFAELYRRQGRILSNKLVNVFYDNDHELLADTLDKNHFSEHCQCLAVLSGYLDTRLESKLSASLLNSTVLTRTTVYFTHYLFETFAKTGAEEAFFKRLSPWMKIEEAGFKTLPEEPEPSRSDCHAWSAHPLYHFYATVAGVRPDMAGFKKVKIKPMLGPLKKLDLEIIHPAGKIIINYKKINNDLSVKINLPADICGELDMDSNIYPLVERENKFLLKK